jgi:hypothetical protein
LSTPSTHHQEGVAWTKKKTHQHHLRQCQNSSTTTINSLEEKQKQNTNRRRQRETLNGRKNENDRNRRRRKPAPIWTRGAKANLFLVAPPPPCCLHREKSFGFEREAADLVLF